MRTYICKQCRKEFIPKRREQQYCSLYCSNKQRNLRDITGKRFGSLIAIKRTGFNNNKESFWQCKCDCGEYKNILLTNLTNGATKSCGCLSTQVHQELIKKNTEKYMQTNFVENTSIVSLKRGKLASNTSGIKGIHWDKARKRWVVQLGFKGVHYSKRFKEEDLDKAIAYRKELEEKYHKPILEKYKRAQKKS